MLIYSYFFILGIFVQAIGYFFQLHKINKRQSTDDLSMMTNVLTFLIMTVFSIYNYYELIVLEESSYLLPVISLTLSTIYNLSLVSLKLIYDKERPKKPEIFKNVCIC